MPFNYAPLSATAVRLIDRFGYDVTIVRSGSTIYPVRIVMVSYEPKDVDGDLIKQTDRKALLAGEGLTFTPNGETDRLNDRGTLLRIVNVTPTSPAGVAIIYEIQLRR